MPFSLLDFKMNSSFENINFIPHIILMLLHYLVKIETPKM